MTPKFPSPHNLMFLLRYYKKYKNNAALQMVEKTLTQMRLGGIFDQIGFGFHRYSTDQKWFLPHFEKMLYDQAMLIHIYTETFQATGNNFYKETAEQIIEYVLRDMTPPNGGGGFYSAEDADSEGVEGKFYLWTKDEIIKILGKVDGEFFSIAYNIETQGNYIDEVNHKQTGENIAYLKTNFETGVDKETIETLRRKLFAEREKRVHPLKDDKILTDWNGLMISALAKAGRIFNNKRFIASAKQAVTFLNNNLIDKTGALLHRYRDGQIKIKGTLDDYAFFIWGLLELFQTTFEPEYLRKAVELTDYSISKFWDDNSGGFFFSEEGTKDLIVRTKEIYDGAIPSGNSVFAMNLLVLGRITSDSRYENYAEEILKHFSDEISRAPFAFTQSLIAYDFLLGPAHEIIICDEKTDSKGIEEYGKILESFIPNKVVIVLNKDNEADLLKQFGYLRNYRSINGKTTYYVCKNFHCELPTNDLKKALDLLG